MASASANSAATVLFMQKIPRELVVYFNREEFTSLWR
jgi:hypothetical protein